MNRLLLVNNYYYRRGGAETIFLEQERAFRDAGWETAVFSMHHPRNEPSAWSGYFADEIEYGTEYSFADKLARAAKVVYSLEARRRLGRLIRDFRPTLAHVHNVYHHLSPAVLAELRSQAVPVVMTLHDLKLACPAYSMQRDGVICERCREHGIGQVLVNRCIKGSLALSALVLAETALHRLLGTYRRSVGRFIVPSRFYREKLAEWGWAPATFNYVPNFVDSAAYRPGDFSSNASAGRRFVYVGRLSREKGLDLLIDAAAAAGVALDLVGAGPEDSNMRAHAARRGVDVRFAGFLSGEALHEAIRAARAVVLPTRTYENAPLAVLEAGALGRAVIGARIGGVPELIREGETGFTFRSGDAADLAARLVEVRDLPDATLAQIGGQARAWIEREFSRARHLERLVAVYRSLGIEAQPLGAIAGALR